MMTKGRCTQATLELAEDSRKRLEQIRFACESFRKCFGCYWEIDIRKQQFKVLVEVVEIGDHRNRFLTSPTRSSGGSFGVVSIDEQCAGARDELALKVGGAQSDRRVASPKHCALPGGFVNQDECSLAWRTRGDDPVRINFLAGHFVHLQLSCGVFANFPYIAGRKAPTAASNDRACDLAARHYIR